MFYPIIFNENASQILDIGEAMPLSEHPSSVMEKKANRLYLWPIRPNGTEGNWQLGKDELKERLSKGYIKWGKITNTGIYVTFLKRGSIQKIEDKEVNVVGRDVVSGIVLVDNSNYSRSFIPGTQWNIANHDASYKGTQLLSKFIGNRFSFPKSLYAVHDTIRFFVANNPNALILDFFSGSGTTLHAVNLLNKEDGGHRRCIMVTNNEVSAEEEKAFRQDPYFNALQVKFAYAVTCHKAQGGQWSHVYVNQGYMTDDMLTSDYIHWLYTAFTRATEMLYLVNWPETQIETS